MEKLLFDSIYYVGACDKTKSLFENLFPLPSGMRYNSYIIKDEKTALLDTADESVGEEFVENVKTVIGENGKLDYLIVHHAEPDHSALVGRILELHPETKLITSAMALKFLNQFADCDFSSRTQTVKEGDVISLGKHSLKFIAAPMVHWPEVLVSYDQYSETLFSADAFGSFGSEEGSLLMSDLQDPESWSDEARRYYSNIVGRFGPNVTALLKKASALKIKRILPLHGLIFDSHSELAVNKYSLWSSYTPENDGTLIVYGSMYNNTKQAADSLATLLSEKNLKSKTVDISYTDFSFIISDCFKYKNIIFACPTYYGSLFPKMEQFLTLFKKTSLTNRRVGFIENGTWSVTAAKIMKDMLADMKIDFSLPTVSFRSHCNKDGKHQLKLLADAIDEK